MELGIHQAEPVERMLEKGGQFASIEILKDLAGIERVVVARRKD